MVLSITSNINNASPLSSESVHNVTFPEGRIICPYDDSIMTLSSIDDISQFSDNAYKGGIHRNSMPDDVKDDILRAQASMHTVAPNSFIPIDKKSGAIEFPENLKTLLKTHTLDYIEHVSQEFNGVGEWQAKFLLDNHISARQLAREFHLEAYSGDQQRPYVGIVSVSSDEEDQDHETEILMTDGLSIREVRDILRQDTPYEELAPLYKDRTTLTHSQDLILIKGLGDGASNILKESLVHRAPPHKASYEEEGKSRTSLVWLRDIVNEPDLG